MKIQSCEHKLYYHPYIPYDSTLWIKQKCRLCNSTFNCMEIDQDDMKLAIKSASTKPRTTGMVFKSEDKIVGSQSDKGSWQDFGPAILQEGIHQEVDPLEVVMRAQEELKKIPPTYLLNPKRGKS
jgi:hypothetical protein